VATAAELSIKIDAEKAIREIKKLERETDDMADSVSSDVKRTENAFERFSDRVTASMRKAAGGVSKAGGLMKTAFAGFAGGLGAGALLGLGSAFSSLGDQLANMVKRGISLSADFETATRGIAASIATTFGKTMPEAMQMSSAALDYLQKVAAKSPATFQQLVQGFQGVTASLSGAGLNLKEQIDLIDLMTQAMGAMGIPADQMRQEIVSIAEANITADSALAKRLSLTNKDIEAAREQGNLYGFLADKLKNYGTLAATTADTLGGKFSNMEDAFDQFAKAAAQPVIGPLKQALDEFTKVLSSAQLRDAMSGMLQWLVESARQMSVLIQWVVQGYNAWDNFTKVIRTNLAALLDQESALYRLAEARHKQLAEQAKLSGNMAKYNEEMALAAQYTEKLTQRTNELKNAIQGISMAAVRVAQETASQYSRGEVYGGAPGGVPGLQMRPPVTPLEPKKKGRGGAAGLEAGTGVSARVTYYGYEQRGQADWDRYSSQAVGAFTSSLGKLVAGRSLALSRDIESRLGAQGGLGPLRPGESITMVFPDGKRHTFKFEDRTSAAISGAADIYAPKGPLPFGGQVELFRTTDIGDMLAQTDELNQSTKDLEVNVLNNATAFEALAAGAAEAAKSFGTVNEQIAEVGSGIVESFASNISDAFTALITGSKDAGEAFADMAKGILNDITQMITKMLVQLAIQQLLGMVGGAIGGKTGAFLQSAAGIAPRATAAQSGGLVHGRGIGDSVPALLTPGEFVMSRGASQRIGYARLAQMNRFQTGGTVGAGGRSGDIVINRGDIVINGGNGAGTAEDMKAREAQAKALANAIDKQIFETILKEQRPGGILTRHRQPRA
jgi:hypothetical protein